MSLDTYENLQSAIANWLSRDDLTAEIPDFIRIAESAINKRLKLTEYEDTDQITSVADTSAYALPTDFKTIRTVWVEGNYQFPLDYRTPAQFGFENPRNTGQPIIYTIKESNIVFGPMPDSDYTINVDYLAMLTPLSDTVTSNFLTETSPETILFGALSEAYGFIKDQESEAKWAGKFGGSLSLLELLVEDMRYAGAALEIRGG